MTASIDFKLPVRFKIKKSIVISSCPVLDIVSQGGTVEEARKNIEEAALLFILTCLEDGTLDSVLKQCGFKTMKKPSGKHSQNDMITIPIPFTVQNHCQPAECRV
ncbi:MAG: type II toxin-antitoxin system HicB family antitoxin [Nitrospirae bacterium]|nr:type II toxin-antitoxin system HicB family antitoxin [Nitrospirota bacterium]